MITCDTGKGTKQNMARANVLSKELQKRMSYRIINMKLLDISSLLFRVSFLNLYTCVRFMFCRLALSLVKVCASCL